MLSDVKTKRVFQALTCVPAVAAVGLLVWGLRPSPQELVVWSCGGNYESLKEYAAAFERSRGVRVTYTAAPVMYLLETALRDPQPPDVIVGRAGPGWIALKQAGKLSHGPRFFAVDPLVIGVAKGNPKGIERIEDLGRPGIRVAQATHAMRPKGKVPALLMAAVSDAFYPGLVERWDANTSARVTCGRKLLEPIASGKADAAVVPRSLLTYPRFRGRFEEVEIPAEILLAMKKGRPSMPQCGGVLPVALQRGRHQLARDFVDGLAANPDWLHRHGYLALEDRRAQELKALLHVSSPKDMPGWQCYLAEKLEDYGVHTEVARRYLKVFYTFGPNGYTARSLCQVARRSLEDGNPAAARLDWRRVMDNYPPKQPVEYDSDVLHAGGQPVPVARQSYEHWLREAASGLASLPHSASADSAPGVLRDPVVKRLFPVEVIESDAPKNGKREMGLGLHLLVIGYAEIATRDLLKVVTLCHDSPYMAEAEYLLGLCAAHRGLGALAARQWRRVLDRHADSWVAAPARAALNTLGDGPSDGPLLPAMPAWGEDYGTHVGRGLAYGMRLYDHHLPLFCYKEMMKIASDIYGQHTLGPELRFRAGVACEAFGNWRAAAYQWSFCAEQFGENPWAERAGKKLQTCPAEALHGLRDAVAAAAAHAAPTSGPAKRLRLAEEFRRAGVHDEGQVLLEYLKVLTVARPPSNPKTRPMLAAAEFQLGVCLAAAGRPGAALSHFEEVIQVYGDTPWAERAERAMRTLPVTSLGAELERSALQR